MTFSLKFLKGISPVIYVRLRNLNKRIAISIDVSIEKQRMTFIFLHNIICRIIFLMLRELLMSVIHSLQEKITKEWVIRIFTWS